MQIIDGESNPKEEVDSTKAETIGKGMKNSLKQYCACQSKLQAISN